MSAHLAAGLKAGLCRPTTFPERLAASDVAVSGVARSDTTEIDEPTNSDGATTRVDPSPVLPPAPDNGAAAPAAAARAAGDLRITKTADSGAKAVLGRAIAYTISVTNAAGRVAHGVVVADQPSAAVSIGSVRPGKGTCSGLTCRLGDLGAGEVVRIHVVMTPKTTGTFENAAVASSDDGERAVADNRAVAGVTIAAARTTLSLEKTVGPHGRTRRQHRVVHDHGAQPPVARVPRASASATGPRSTRRSSASVARASSAGARAGRRRRSRRAHGCATASRSACRARSALAR